MFSKTAAFYDAIYSFKDYAAESAFLKGLITERLGHRGHTVLDVACGTGAHIAHLRDTYELEGLDLDAELLAIARERNPAVAFQERDMTDFDLGKQFDVVMCLFSSIGYAKTLPRLNSALAAFARHTRPGGLVIVEPWITPDKWMAPHLGAAFVNLPELKVARMNLSGPIQAGDVLTLQFYYLVGTLDGIQSFTETHEMGMFTDEDYCRAFEGAGLSVERLDEGLMGRGVYVGVRR